MGISKQSLLAKMLKRYIPKWRLFLFAVIGCLIAAYLYLRVTQPVFKITASLVVIDKEKMNTEKTALSELDLSPVSKSVEVEMEVLHSRKLIWKVIDSLGLNSGKSNVSNVVDSAELIDDYLSRLEISLLNQKSAIVELSIKDTNSKKAESFLNALISIYNLNNTQSRIKDTQENLLFIENRLSALSGDLKDVESNIELYKSSRSMTDPLTESRLYMESQEKNKMDRDQVLMKLGIIDGIERSLATPGNVPASIGIDDDGLKNLIDQLSGLQQSRSKLLATTPESNQLFIPINNQIKVTTDAIKATVANIKSSLLTMSNQFKQVDKRVESSIKSIPGQERGYVSIKRQQAIKEELFNYLLKKHEEVGLNYQTTNRDASIVDAAYISGIVWPKKPLVYALAIIFALGITASFIYIQEMVSDTTMSIEEVEEALDKPILTELNYVRNSAPIVAVGNGNTIISQQFRALRTNLYYVHGSRGKGRVTMISSSKSGEGKSFAASNLAISLAASGRKTVIIDMDLHKPKIGDIFGLDADKKGLSDFLNEDSEIKDIVKVSSLFENLSIITSGATISNPSELIENLRLETLILNLRDQFDDIIMDTPPLHMVTDGFVLSQYSDACLYVIRKGITKRTEFDFIQRLLDEKRLPNVNLIFNGTTEVAGSGY